MKVTCSFNDFKDICKDSIGLKYGGVIIYVNVAGTGVTLASFFNTARLGVTFVLTNTPSQNNFLTDFPDAIKVDNIEA